MGSILCVDTSVLDRNPKIQKKVDLQKILTENSKYFSTKELENPSLNARWKPLKFATTIRSIYSNRVLCIDIEEENRTVYYHTYGSVDRLIHKGFDLIMFLSSNSVMESIDGIDKIKLNDVMFNHSEFQCLGLYYNVGIVNPIIYSIVYIDDDAFADYFENATLNLNWRIEDISKMKEDSHGNLQALIDEIKEVSK